MQERLDEILEVNLADDYAKLSGTINGSGSTFQKAFDDEVIKNFKTIAPSVTVNYAGGGSGKGKQDLADQVVDFAGTDSTVKHEDMSKYKGGAIFYFPTVVGPITVSYNLSGVDKLQLERTTLAKIMQRKVTTWNDAAIAADNPGVTLPEHADRRRAPLGRLGHHQQLHQVPQGGRPYDWKLDTRRHRPVAD